MRRRTYAVDPGGRATLELVTDGDTSVILDGDELGRFTKANVRDGTELVTPQGWTLRLQKIGSTFVVFRDGKPLPAIARTLRARVLLGLTGAIAIAAGAALSAVPLYRHHVHRISVGMFVGIGLLVGLAALAWRGLVDFMIPAIVGGLVAIASLAAFQIAYRANGLSQSLMAVELVTALALVFVVNARGPSRALRGKRVGPPIHGIPRVLMILGVALVSTFAFAVLLFGGLVFAHFGPGGEIDADDRADRARADREVEEAEPEHPQPPWLRFVTADVTYKSGADASRYLRSLAISFGDRGVWFVDDDGRVLDEAWQSYAPHGKHLATAKVGVACDAAPPDTTLVDDDARGTGGPCVLTVTAGATTDRYVFRRDTQRSEFDQQWLLADLVKVALGLPGAGSDTAAMMESTPAPYENLQAERILTDHPHDAELARWFQHHAATLDAAARASLAATAEDWEACFRAGIACEGAIEFHLASFKDKLGAIATVERLLAQDGNAAARRSSASHLAEALRGVDLPEEVTVRILLLGEDGDTYVARYASAYVEDPRARVAAAAREALDVLSHQPGATDFALPGKLKHPAHLSGPDLPPLGDHAFIVDFEIGVDGAVSNVTFDQQEVGWYHLRPDPAALAALGQQKYAPGKFAIRRTVRVRALVPDADDAKEH